MPIQKKLLPILLGAVFSVGAAQAVDLIAIGSLSALGFDRSSASAGALENGVPGNLLGGLGSGIAYAGNNTFVATPDRGPNATTYNALVDDTTSYIARYQTLELRLTENISGTGLAFKLTPVLTNTTLLSSPTALVYGSGSAYGLGSGAPAMNDAAHAYFTGRSDNFDASKPSTNLANARLDPEAVRVSKDGKSVFVSDEYGPYVYQFERATGQRINTFALPEKFGITHLSASGDAEIAANASGRISNKGMEGLAITPDGKTLVGIMQANLAQDAKTMLRVVTIDIASGATKEFAYKLSSGSGVSEIVALNDHQFLVDERDGKGLGDGSAAAVKQVFMVDLTGATEVGTIAKLKTSSPSLGKTLFIDLVSVLGAHGYTGSQIPAKIEGLAFGADVTIGGVVNHTLYVANDNDFAPAGGDNQFFVFGVTDSDLAKVGASYQAQEISAVPEPGTLAMMMAGLGMIGLCGRRVRAAPFAAKP